MIRLFSNICKYYHELKLIKLNDYDLLMKFSFSCENFPPCPKCKAPSDSYRMNGGYYRHFIYRFEGAVFDKEIYIKDFRCTSCGTTHALLNSLIIPYSSFSIGFIIELLYYRLTHLGTSIEKLCELFMISESTYYRIRRRLYIDYHQMCSLLNLLHNAIELVKSLSSLKACELHDLLNRFFKHTGYSFMQPRIKFRQEINWGKVP